MVPLSPKRNFFIHSMVRGGFLFPQNFHLHEGYINLGTSVVCYLLPMPNPRRKRCIHRATMTYIGNDNKVLNDLQELLARITHFPHLEPDDLRVIDEPGFIRINRWCGCVSNSSLSKLHLKESVLRGFHWHYLDLTGQKDGYVGDYGFYEAVKGELMNYDLYEATPSL